NDSLLCIGLDPDLRRFPTPLDRTPEAIAEFNRAIVEATVDLACAYKPNLGFYLAHGEAGVRALVATREAIPRDIPVILDAKVADIGSTSEAYARGYFETWGFDAVTAHPYLGADSLEPFLRYADRGVFILAKTSNPGSGDLQDLPVQIEDGQAEPLYLRVAETVARLNERYGTCGLVVGATYPRQLAAIRERCPDLPILVPGVGAQGGDLEATLQSGLDRHGRGVLITVSRAVTYASDGPDFAAAARAAAARLRDEINRLRAGRPSTGAA
ncbi:MAG: orotidine-5'-phosphate decarboxylase, partial [Thermomicrobiaceae bacterium]|nr:orotidine-5'-phosphate decarboxylase [Thermomicrobiaceae bacterium]